ncbi:MAG TPA: hypothetical protein VLG28_12105 [Acidimicrobiia bacterium]|jgi:hypothetical protein|nr:hypothetical protein [Acidimicrobiia bacterium]
MEEGANPSGQDAASHWKPVLVIGLLAAVVMVLPLLVLPQTSERRASQTSAEYADVLRALQTDVVAANSVLDLLTDPGVEESQFATALPLLSDLDAHAEAARAVTSGRSLAPWPLAPAEPLDALLPIRDALAAAAPATDAIVADLVGLLNYRAAYARMLRIRELPSVAPQPFERFRNQLDEMVRTEMALLDELPSAELLREHRSAVSRALRGLNDWTDDYVAALWIGDEPAIQRLLREHALLRLELDRGLTQRIAAIRVELDERLRALEDDLGGALAAVES